jgi:hypothetical protein
MAQRILTSKQTLQGTNNPQWSYTRREILELCPRRYYYQYYGSSVRTAKNDPQKHKLRFLKRIKNRNLRVGEILHLVIRTYLMELQLGNTWSLVRLLKWARDIYRRDIEYSKSYPLGTSKEEKYTPCLLLEYYYERDDAEHLCVLAEKSMINALTIFKKREELSPFFTGVGTEDSIIEKSSCWKDNRFTIRGKIDLAYRNLDRVTVVDWKIGDNNSTEDSLQLLSYAMLAMSHFKCKPDLIDLFRVHLGVFSVEKFVFNEVDMMRVKGRILQDLEKMQALEKYGRNGNAEAFTPCFQQGICILCQYQAVYPKDYYS